MSASLDKFNRTKMQSCGPQFPPEIWLWVFESISCIPGVFELSNAQTIEAYSEDYNGIILHGLYDEIMKSKLSISLVSWTWRRLVLPSLFEYVVIKSARHARAVASLLARFRRQQGEGEYYGRWIKRVEVFVQDFYWEQESIDAIARVLKLAPNVLVYSDYFSSGRLPDYATHTIARAVCRLCERGRLKRLESCGATLLPLHRVLRASSSLEVLILKHMLTQSVDLPNLRTLVCGRASSGTTFCLNLALLGTPNLINLILHNTPLTSVFYYCHAPISDPYPNLRHFRCLYLGDNISLFHLTDLCRLTSLTLEMGQKFPFDDLDTLRFKQQSLQRINVVHFPVFTIKGRFGDDDERQGQLRRISNFLDSLLETKDYPSLRAIGFLRDRSYFDAGDLTKRTKCREHNANLVLWNRFLDRCKAQDVAVEASVGANNHFRGVWQDFHLGLVP